MEKPIPHHSSRPVAIWLLIGVVMIMIQVLLGGITRLTGSGLSITEWDPLLSHRFFPMNDQQWNDAFAGYKKIAQFKLINSSFTLQDFKSIYFWEWLHRVWARLIAVAFAIPFVIFLIQKRFKPEMVKPMIILFLLGALQGLVGWIMVVSGLNEENIYVSHYRLAIHFILALGLACYAFWFALDLLIPVEQRQNNSSLKKFTGWLIVILILQLIYGAFMAGLKAAVFAPTWPDINGNFLPRGGNPAGLMQIFDNPITVQFIHRSLAYTIAVLILIWFLRSDKKDYSRLFRNTNWIPLAIVITQILLGIATVLNSPNQKNLLWLGVSHQFMGMLLLLSLIFSFYLCSGNKKLIRD